MEVYTLDSLYRRIDVIDDFNSLIWTERFSAYGDFEIDINSTSRTRKLFTEGTRLAMNESYRVMVVDTAEDTIDDDGQKILKVTGKSLENILDDRAALGALSDLTTMPTWTVEGTPMGIARQIFTDICVTGILDPGDIISGISMENIFPDDSIPEPPDIITVNISPMSVYSAIKQVADMYFFGFRLVRDPMSNLLYWNVYSGSDRTTRQTDRPAVVFAPGLDNLQNVTSLKTSAGYKNVAYVISPVGHLVVYRSDVDPDVTGFERHVLVVDASDVTDPDTATVLMQQKAQVALNQNGRAAAFDGEVSQNGQYKYGRDYNLGDLVEMRDDDGTRDNMQVTEQIFVSDNQGERSYPTLTLNEFVTVGAWNAVDINLEWQDMGTTEFWSNQP